MSTEQNQSFSDAKFHGNGSLLNSVVLGGLDAPNNSKRSRGGKLPVDRHGNELPFTKKNSEVKSSNARSSHSSEDDLICIGGSGSTTAQTASSGYCSSATRSTNSSPSDMEWNKSQLDSGADHNVNSFTWAEVGQPSTDFATHLCSGDAAVGRPLTPSARCESSDSLSANPPSPMQTLRCRTPNLFDDDEFEVELPHLSDAIDDVDDSDFHNNSPERSYDDAQVFGSMSSVTNCGPTARHTSQMDADEVFARQLQAEFDAESQRSQLPHDAPALSSPEIVRWLERLDGREPSIELLAMAHDDLAEYDYGQAGPSHPHRTVQSRDADVRHRRRHQAHSVLAHSPTRATLRARRATFMHHPPVRHMNVGVQLGSGGVGDRRRGGPVVRLMRMREELEGMSGAGLNASLNYEELVSLSDMLGDAMQHSLSEHQINRLPVLTYTAEHRAAAAVADQGSDEWQSCRICMCDYQKGDLLRVLPCFHSFHSECIDQWLRRKVTCPMCRVDARKVDGASDCHRSLTLDGE